MPHIGRSQSDILYHHRTVSANTKGTLNRDDLVEGLAVVQKHVPLFDFPELGLDDLVFWVAAAGRRVVGSRWRDP